MARKRRTQPSKIDDKRASRPFIITGMKTSSYLRMKYGDSFMRSLSLLNRKDTLVITSELEWEDLNTGPHRIDQATERWKSSLLTYVRHIQLDGRAVQVAAEGDAEVAFGKSPPAVPPVGERLIAFFCSADIAEAMLGDLEEKFAELVETRGFKKARRWYWWQVGWVGLCFGWRWLQRLAALEAVLRRIGL